MTTRPQINILRFGIPTLDRLLGSVPYAAALFSEGSSSASVAASSDRRELVNSKLEPLYGIGVCSGLEAGATPTIDAVSICLIGEDGVGKSLLAMHLASRYRADSGTEDMPFIIYASTDLSYGRANLSWDNFALRYPLHRIMDPFEYTEVFSKWQLKPDEFDPARKNSVELESYRPFTDSFPEHPSDSVRFLDLATHTCGDDWAYLNRLTASLPQPGPTKPRHLLVVDAVEGLEVLVGEKDAFGQSRDRRSRVAQLLRIAAEKCHVILLVEKQDSGKKAPEEFIADAVISLSRANVGGYARRTIEIEKVRSQSHVRGHHEITFRSGSGSTTGTRFNADDPFVAHPVSRLTRGQSATAHSQQKKADFDTHHLIGSQSQKPQGYAFVFHSLHHVHRQVMEERSPLTLDEVPKRVTGFGIDHLDEILLAVRGRRTPYAKKHDSSDTMASENNADHDDGDTSGIPVLEPTALIGEDGTYKSKLSKAFLAQAHHPDRVNKGVAVLLTTKALDERSLTRRLDNHMTDGKVVRKPGHHVLCRRLEVHHVSSAILFHIFKQAIRRAQLAYFERIGLPLDDLNDEQIRRRHGWSIRLVVDNWTAIGNLYPQVKEDPLFWPCVLFFLRREGIATLIVAGEPIGFSRHFQLAQTARLQDLTSIQIFTWRVPFFGESRVAITVTPPLHGDYRGSVIRELRLLAEPMPRIGGNFAHYDGVVDGFGENEDQARSIDRHHRTVPQFNSQRVAVNPTFELYDGLEQGPPRYVPLQVWLFEYFAENTGGSSGYIHDVGPMFNWLLSDMPDPNFRAVVTPTNSADGGNKPSESQSGIIHIGNSRYSALREFCELQGVARFRYTLVMQVDEYWAKANRSQFASVHQYLGRATASVKDAKDNDGKGMLAVTKQYAPADPFMLWQPSAIDLERFRNKGVRAGDVTRCDYFSTRGYDLRKMQTVSEHLAKVPYSWDFGFLMLDHEAWQTNVTSPHEIDYEPIPARPAIECVRFLDGSETEDPVKNSSSLPPLSWRHFAEIAAKLCGSLNTDESNIEYIPLAVAPEVQETLSCLFLEVWVSQIESHRQNIEDATMRFKLRRDDNESAESLADAVEKYRAETVESLLLLSLLIPPEAISDDNEIVSVEELKKKGVVPIAIRSWYSASKWFEALSSQEPNEGESETVPESDIGGHTTCKRYFVPAQLPGTRIVRGDWFLSIARGSRSIQMGERAFDLLCSRRGNIVRLQKGIGLPVRESADESARELWTAIWHYAEEQPDLTQTVFRKNVYRKRRRIKYKELMQLAAVAESGVDQKMKWLWRSRIGQYDRHSRIFRRWICAMLKRMPQMLNDKSGKSELKFKLLDKCRVEQATNIHALRDVVLAVEEFIRSLRRATAAPWIDEAEIDATG